MATGQAENSGLDYSFTKEEAHRQRLNQSNIFFQSVLSEQDRKSLGTKEFVQTLILYLQDYWSVIRSNSSKFLQSIVTTLLPEEIDSLVFHFKLTIEDSSFSWQALHGTILGWISLVSILTEEILESLTKICLEYIGHVRNPIRDVCKDGLVNICLQSKYPQGFIAKILNIIQTNIDQNLETSQDESVTLHIDGLLSCVTELIPSLDIRKFYGSTHPQLPSTVFDSVITKTSLFSFEQFITILRLCMLHSASTVRQKAGSIISKLLAAMLKDLVKSETRDSIHEQAKRSIHFILKSVLIEILIVQSIDYWHGQEISLIICDEFIRYFISLLFEGLLQLADSEKFADIQHQQISLLPIAELVHLNHFLHNHLLVFICHPRFEVRRVILQLIPTIVRGKILLETYSVDSESFDKLKNNTSDTEHSRLLNNYFQLTVQMIWISSLIKENRHLQEAINSSENQLAEASINANWSNEVHGRLLEVELRNEFHQYLTNLVRRKSDVLQQWTIKTLISSDQYILHVLEVFFSTANVTLSKTVEKERTEQFTSMDFVEFYVLVHCFLSNLRDRSCQSFSPAFDNDLLKTIVDTTISTSNELLILLERHALSWISLLAYLQYISAFKGSVNHGEEALSPTQFILPIIENTVESRFSTEAENYDRLFNIKHCWNTEANEQCSIRLLPTLTDPATNPVIYSSDIIYHAFESEKKSIIPSPITSAASTRPSSLNMTINVPETPNRSSKSYPTSPHTGKVLILASPNKLGAGSNLPVVSTINSFPSMNQWNCEAISPLLYQFSLHQTDAFISISLSAVITEWISHSFQDALWLDNRRYAKRMLIECFPVLISNFGYPFPFQESERFMDLLLSSTTNLLEGIIEQSADIKILIPIFKALTALIVLVRVPHGDTSRSIYSNLNILKPKLDRVAHRYRERYCSVLNSPSRGSPKTSSNMITFPTFLHPLNFDGKEISDEDGVEEKSDEFSDWDEEEDESIVAADNQSNTTQQTLLISALICEIDQLEKELQTWQD